MKVERHLLPVGFLTRGNREEEMGYPVGIAGKLGSMKS